jgi:hypothetical protein
VFWENVVTSGCHDFAPLPSSKCFSSKLEPLEENGVTPSQMVFWQNVVSSTGPHFASLVQQQLFRQPADTFGGKRCDPSQLVFWQNGVISRGYHFAPLPSSTCFGSKLEPLEENVVTLASWCFGRML